MTQQIRYAVVGAGWITQEAFLPAVQATGNSVVTALVTGDSTKAKFLSERYGIKHIYSYDEYLKLLNDDVADAVYLALPNDMHHEFAIATLNHGRHLLLEKPMALDETECRQIIEASEKSNAKLMIAYRLHYEPATLAALTQIRSGKIGQPRFFTACFSQCVDPKNHRADPKHWAGPLPDLGIYPLNIARKLFEAEPLDVMAMRSYNQSDNSVHESIAVILRFPMDRLAQFIVNYGAAGTDSYRVVGTKGDLQVSAGFGYDQPIHHVLTVDGKTKEEFYAPTSQFGGELQYFSQCILDDVVPKSDGWEGLADVRIIRAIEQSYLQGRTVQIETLPDRPGLDPANARELKPEPKGAMVNAYRPNQSH